MPLDIPTARWPSDYVVTVDGRLWIHPAFEGALIHRGWRTVDAVMGDNSVSVRRRIAERDNASLDLVLPREGRSVPCYLKRHWSRSLVARWRERGWSGMPPGLAEAHAVGKCQAAGVDTMTVIAAGWRPGQTSSTDESFFLSAKVPGEPADDLWRQRASEGDWRPGGPERAALLVSLATLARKLHAARLFHRDFYWCHFLVEESGPTEFRPRLIDLQRIHSPRLIAQQPRLKDLAQFFYSAPRPRWTPDEEALWWKTYLGERSGGWRAAVRLRAWFYSFKDGEP